MSYELNAIQQTQAWAKFQELLPNRKAWQIDEVFIYKLHLHKQLSFLYIPGISTTLSAATLNKIKDLAIQEHCAFTHIETYEEIRGKRQETREGNKKNRFFSKLSSLNSPLAYLEPWTSYLDLTLSEKDMLAQMKSKGRYNVRLAAKKGITIQQETNVSNFYKLFKTTTTRDGFSGYNQEYYQKMVDTLGPNHCRIFTAFYKNKPLASLILTLVGTTATYYYGASSNEHRNLMAPYLVQWEAIKFAKEKDYKFYDFMGIAPPNSKKHKLGGVTRFKSMFGGNNHQFAPAFDIIYSPIKYWPFWLYKKLRG